MNLLIDQREPSQDQEPAWRQSGAETPVSPLQEETSAPPTVETPLDYYHFDETDGHKRSLWGPLLIIVVLLAAIIAAAYYGFFYKSHELSSAVKPSTQLESPREMPTATTPVTGTGAEEAVSQPATAPVSESPAAGAEKEPPATMPAVTPRESAVLTTAASGAAPLVRASELLTAILAARPGALQLNILIMDQGSFSAEVSADDRAAVESFAAALRSALPGGSSPTPPSGYYSGTRALVTGVYPGLNPATMTPVEGSTLAAAKQTLRSAAETAGLRLHEITQSRVIERSSGSWTPLFVKVSGREQQFSNYCQVLAAQLPAMRLDKIILEREGADAATGVLRLEALTR